jgi:hypothetical protein
MISKMLFAEKAGGFDTKYHSLRKKKIMKTLV